MKRTLLYIGSVFILILSAITFIFIPAMLDRQRNSDLPAAGSFNGKKILYTQDSPFAISVANLEQWDKQRGQELNQNSYGTIYTNAFYATIAYLTATDAVHKSGYAPSTSAISREMLSSFADETGAYSARLFNNTSESKRNEIKTEATNYLTWNRFYDDVFGTGASISNLEFMGLSCLRNHLAYVYLGYPITVGGNALFGIKTSDAESAFMAQFGADKRSFDLVAWEKSQYPEDRIIAFGTEHASLFTTYDLSLVAFDDKAQAEKVLKQLKNNEITFTDAVSEYPSTSYYAGSDGVLLMNYAYQLKQLIPDETAFNAVTALEAEEISDVVQTLTGFAIFRRDNKVADEFVPSENIDIIRNYINSYETSIIEAYYTDIAKNFTANALTTSFDRACREYDVSKVSVPAFALNYGNSTLYDPIPSDVQELNGASRNEYFLEKAFSLTVGEISEPLVLGNAIIVLKMTGEQNDAITEEHTAAIKDSVASIDERTAEEALFYSDAATNNLAEFYNAITVGSN